MKTLIAAVLAIAAGSAMACPGDKTASVGPGSDTGKDSSVASVERVPAAEIKQVVARADEKSPQTKPVHRE